MKGTNSYVQTRTRNSARTRNPIRKQIIASQTSSLQREIERRKESQSVVIPHEAIALRAYQKFLARGCQHGNDWADWFEAERELKAELQNR